MTLLIDLLDSAGKALYGEPIHNPKLEAILDRYRFQGAVTQLATLLKEDRNDILVISRRKAQKDYKPTEVISLRFVYNRRMNAAMGEIEGTWFTGNNLSWNVRASDGISPEIARLIADNFSVVIDWNQSKWSKAFEDPTNMLSEIAAFRLLPFHIEVKPQHVLAAIREARPTDKYERLYVCTGTDFTHHYGQTIHTRMPFLILRFYTNENLRYLIYNVLGRCVEKVEFGFEKGVRTVYARYAQTIRETGEKTITDPNQIIPESATGRLCFSAASPEATQRWNAVVKEFQPIILSSDYVTMEETYGADAATYGTLGYIHACRGQYYPRIANFFYGNAISQSDHTAQNRIIILADPVLKSTQLTLAVLAHEVAHWLKLEFYPVDGDPHDLTWLCITNLLQMLLSGDQPHMHRERSVAKYLIGRTIDEHPVDAERLQCALDEILELTAIGMMQSRPNDEPYTTHEIVLAAHYAMNEAIENYRFGPNMNSGKDMVDPTEDANGFH